MDCQQTVAPLWIRLSCALWGHVVDNELFRREAVGVRRCRCGVEYLSANGPTHIRHTLSCFVRHHTYVLLAKRDRVHEYVCVRCGHPLVLSEDTDRFAGRDQFAKKVRYACAILGHRVTTVAERNGFVEYACACGHSFLERVGGKRMIRNPLNCFVRAHRIVFVAPRGGYEEYVCEDCGHPFCFAQQQTDYRVGEEERAMQTG